MPPTIIYLGNDSDAVANRLKHYQELAREVGQVDFKFADKEWPLDQLAEQCGDTRAIMLATPFDGIVDLARRLPNLKLVQIGSAGANWIDVEGLAGLGVRVSDNNGANAVPVAEHTMALILALYRHLEDLFNNVRRGDWAADHRSGAMPFPTLTGKRVGIIGLGRIGSRVARRLSGWDCDVVFHDIRTFDQDYLDHSGVRPLPLDQLLSSSDVVTVHVPLDRTTEKLISSRELALMKKSAVLINTCRGPVVDETALIQALQEKRLWGAGLDVTEVEPIADDNPLLSLPNVIITPHLATLSPEGGALAAHHIAINTARVALGREPTSVVRLPGATS